ncbi:cation transport protein-domain-containing protein [Phyllosticta citriasiana]|uniref:Potassium transport protein n=1 Tax=Phyllosticta citriasiana TaxID=595635 RepID=A0ABR1KUK3_9PEZI
MVEPHLRIRSALGPVSRTWRIVRRKLPPLNFITIHYAYFLFTCLLSAIIFWGASTPAKSVNFTDAIFLCVSAMTLTGLNTVNLSELNTFQQFMLFFLIVIGSGIFVSSFVLLVRKRAFEAKIHKVVQAEKAKQAKSRRFSLRRNSSRARNGMAQDVQSLEEIRPDHAMSDGETHLSVQEHLATANEKSVQVQESAKPEPQVDDYILPCTPKDDHISFGPDLTPTRRPRRHSHRLLNMQGVGAHSSASLPQQLGPLRNSVYMHHSQPVDQDDRSTVVDDKISEMDEKSLARGFSGFVGRNSQFYHLSEAERLEIGGVEYKAVKFLSIIVPLYYVLWQLLSCIGIGAYVAYNRPSTAHENGLNPWWVGAFNAVSAFNNSGMSLLDANMTAFQTAYYMLLTMGLCILAGNTCYPIFLRLIIWTIRKLLPNTAHWDDLRNTLRFLLDHPRRCYTNLFPSEHTWWLALSVITLNAIDWAAFEVLNIGNKAINDLPGAAEVIDGLFQAMAVRSGGFYVVSMTQVRVSLQILYVIMMYISVYPVVITMRNSNVYEERSLGIYADDPIYSDHRDTHNERSLVGFVTRQLRSPKSDGGPHTKSYFLRQQLRAQLAHDLWWLVLAVFIIMIIEGSQFERDPANFSVFNVIFETVSGYGCVGISIGVPDDAYSFSGCWHKLSKLVLCAVMIRGRHRGLPVAIDKAVLLPSEAMFRAEEEDAQIRMVRSVSRRERDMV